MARSDVYRREFDSCIEEFKEKFKETLRDLEAKGDEAVRQVEYIKNEEQNILQASKNVQELVTLIQNAHGQIFNSKGENLSTVDDIEDSHEKINKWYNEIQDLHKELFGSTIKVRGKEITPEEAEELGADKFTQIADKFYLTETKSTPSITEKTESKKAGHEPRFFDNVRLMAQTFYVTL